MPALKEALTKQYGPLPAWGWMVVVVGGVAVWFIVRRSGSSDSSAALVPVNTSVPGTTGSLPAGGGGGGGTSGGGGTGTPSSGGTGGTGGAGTPPPTGNLSDLLAWLHTNFPGIDWSHIPTGIPGTGGTGGTPTPTPNPGPLPTGGLAALLDALRSGQTLTPAQILQLLNSGGVTSGGGTTTGGGGSSGQGIFGGIQFPAGGPANGIPGFPTQETLNQLAAAAGIDTSLQPNQIPNLDVNNDAQVSYLAAAFFAGDKGAAKAYITNSQYFQNTAVPEAYNARNAPGVHQVNLPSGAVEWLDAAGNIVDLYDPAGGFLGVANATHGPGYHTDTTNQPYGTQSTFSTGPVVVPSIPTPSAVADHIDHYTTNAQGQQVPVWASGRVGY